MYTRIDDYYNLGTVSLKSCDLLSGEISSSTASSSSSSSSCPSPSNGHWYLVQENYVKEVYPTDAVTIGSDQQCEIVLSSQSADPHHARIHTGHGNRNMKIKDLGAVNGTFVNNVRIESQSEIDLKHNDKISFGSDPLILTVKQGINDYSLNEKSVQSDVLHSPFELDAPLYEQSTMTEQRQSNSFLIDRMSNDENHDNNHDNNNTNSTSYTTVTSNSQPLIDSNEDASSDAGTYIIDIEHRDLDVEDNDDDEETEPQQQELEQEPESPLSFKRYTSNKRHGTYNIHAASPPSPEKNPPILPAMSTIYARPVVGPDHNTTELPSSTSPLSKIRLEPEGDDQPTVQESTTQRAVVYARRRPQTLTTDLNSSTENVKNNDSSSITTQTIKPAESFVISPTIEKKPSNNFGEKNFNVTRKMHRIYSAGAADTLMNFEAPKAEPAALSSSTLTNMITTYQNELDNMSTTNSSFPSTTTTATGLSMTKQGDTEKGFTSVQRLTKTSSAADVSNDRLRIQSVRSPPVSKKPLSNTDTSSSSSKLLAAVPISNSPRSNIANQETFQRNNAIRKTMPNRSSKNSTKPFDIMSSSLIGELPSSHTSSRSNSVADDLEAPPSLSKVSMNKSFALRRQRSNLTTTNKVQQQQPPSTVKPVQRPTFTKSQTPSIQICKPADSIHLDQSSSMNSQTNRAVELRKASARAKMEELSHRTKQQQQPQDQTTINQLMTTSLYSVKPSTSLNKKNDVRSTYRSVTKRPLSIPTHRSSSASPKALSHDSTATINRASQQQQQQPAKSRLSKLPTKSSSMDQQNTSKMNTAANENEPERCETLRDDGQRLAIKLIQLSSGILEKLKTNEDATNDDSSIKELEQLVDKLQVVNKTLSTIDASLSMSTNNDSLSFSTSPSHMASKQNYRSSTNFE